MLCLPFVRSFGTKVGIGSEDDKDQQEIQTSDGYNKAQAHDHKCLLLTIASPSSVWHSPAVEPEVDETALLLQ